MALYPIAGQKFYIGGVLEPDETDFVEADFSGVTWVEVDGWSNSGSAGDSATLISTALINRGRDIKQKGSANAGSMQNQFVVIADDPGQIALIAAGIGSNKSNYAFKIEGNETAGFTAPSERLFAGLVMGVQETPGDANTIRQMDVTVEINSNIVTVAATPVA